MHLLLKSSNGQQLALSADYKFNWQFGGDQACREVATSMPLAVPALIRRAVTHQDFARLLRPSQ